jgi:hypothetical protein
MKRMRVVLLVTAGCLFAAAGVSAQLGMNLNPFSKPNITDIFKPVVGNGALYQSQRTGRDQTMQLEMIVVGKEIVDGQQGWWLEMGMDTPRGGSSQLVYSKMLMTADFQMKKVVFQLPGQPAMEMPYNDSMKTRMKEESQKWHQAGSESITVPAGTFSCVHWKKDQGDGDVWASDKVSPMSMVKMVDSAQTLVLMKVISGASDHITGPVTKFDPQAFGRMMMQQQQQKP